MAIEVEHYSKEKPDNIFAINAGQEDSPPMPDTQAAQEAKTVFQSLGEVARLLCSK